MNEDEEQAREIAHANEILNAVRHAIAAEREACAKIAESCDALGPDFADDELTAEGYIARKKIRQVAAAIRARGTT